MSRSRQRRMVADYIAELLLDDELTLDECVALIRAGFPNHVLLVRDFVDACVAAV